MSSATPPAAQNDVGQPHRPMRRHERPLGHRPPAVHDDVVGEDNADSKCEASQLAVLAAGDTDRQADHPENEAGHRERELLVDPHDRAVWRRPLRPHGGHLGLQLRNRHLVQPVLRPVDGEDRFRVETEDHLVKPVHVVGGRVLRVDAVPATGGQDDIYHAVVAVEHHPALLGDVHLGLLGVAVIGQEDAGPPGALDVHLPHVQDDPWEALIEDPRLHLVACLRGHRAVGDFAKGLVRFR